MTAERRETERVPSAEQPPRSVLPVLLKGIAEFNSGRYFEAHEILEEIWLPSPPPLRDFYQGVIQVAAALVHFQRNERPGTEGLLRRGLARLGPFLPDFMGVETGRLVEDMRRFQRALADLKDEPLDRMDARLLPKIELRPRPTSGRLSVRGVGLHYLDWGGDGPPLVILHGEGHLAALWSPVASALARRFRVVAVDQRGHGASDRPGEYGRRAFVEDFIALLEDLHVERPIIVGHSLGGTVALMAEAERPGTASRLVLIEPSVVPPESEAAWREGSGEGWAREARRRRAVWGNEYEMFTALRQRPPFAAWRSDILWTYVEEGTEPLPDGRLSLRCPPDLEARLYDDALSTDVSARLEDVRCPALVLRSDAGFFADAASRIATVLPDARLATVAGSDHFLPFDDPPQVAAHIGSFATL
jgi:pimeloyl-ACP methyl ester carboxylesterase